ncbi:molybdate ABC transporter substrate-binding protein [Tepidibacillus fermentans]|uniref:Molybdate transport system substrate-binding protein n=1 Tax=Tepidibacillus fermentans TaxID=1281767 RepID=A0A4R3KIV9_9BACI|nr:molybdate ABC transporter substrate-binding protein [Tepidibacillus fermentans]TCS83152.1 molybdate transport system substrate-binding protein [Tepidibacillus fermentans]
MKKTNFLLLILGILLINTACTHSQPTTNKSTLTVSIAASLTDVMNELKTIFEKEHQNISIHFNVGGSGTLAGQIEQGAPVDMFISASEEKMDRLEKKGLLLERSRKNLLSNQLVLIMDPDLKLANTSLKSLTSPLIQHIVIGDPDNVPAGKYAKQVLEHLNLLEKVQPKLVYTKDVRQVLSYVETGNAEAGIVYLSDTMKDGKRLTVTEIDPTWHDPIVYPIAIIKESKFKKEAQSFIDFLSSQQGQMIIKKYGFIPFQS